LKIIGQFQAATEKMYTAYAAFVADWNWLDEESGLPLPKPTKAEVFKNDLFEDQTTWLASQIEKLERYRATEGNVKSGSTS
jgi:hypothetical protein